MKNRYLFLLILAFLFQTGTSQAQVSLLDEVSNVYLEKLIAVAKENYPRVGSNKGQIAVAKSNLISQKSNWLDGLSFSYIYKPNNTLDIINPTFFNGYQVAISFSVTELFQKSSNVRQAKEAVKIAQLSYDEYILSLETQVKTRYYSYVLQKNVLTQQNKAYSDALSLAKDVAYKYSKGENTFTEFVQSQNALSSALQAKWNAEITWLTAKATLEELLTRKLEEIL